MLNIQTILIPLQEGKRLKKLVPHFCPAHASLAVGLNNNDSYSSRLLLNSWSNVVFMHSVSRGIYNLQKINNYKCAAKFNNSLSIIENFSVPDYVKQIYSKLNRNNS